MANRVLFKLSILTLISCNFLFHIYQCEAVVTHEQNESIVTEGQDEGIDTQEQDETILTQGQDETIVTHEQNESIVTEGQDGLSLQTTCDNEKALLAACEKENESLKEQFDQCNTDLESSRQIENEMKEKLANILAVKETTISETTIAIIICVMLGIIGIGYSYISNTKHKKVADSTVVNARATDEDRYLISLSRKQIRFSKDKINIAANNLSKQIAEDIRLKNKRFTNNDIDSHIRLKNTTFNINGINMKHRVSPSVYLYIPKLSNTNIQTNAQIPLYYAKHNGKNQKQSLLYILAHKNI